MIYLPYYSKILLFGIFCLFVSLFYGCHSTEQRTNAPEPGQHQPAGFEHPLEVRYAKGFDLTYRENYKLLEILNAYQDRTDTLRYVLKPRGVQLDTLIRGARVIDIPVRTMILTSTTHLALAEVLDANNVIEGMVAAEYVYSPEVRNRIENGEVVSFPQGEFNKEKALQMNPDLVMVSAGQSSQLDDYRVLMNSGIDVLINSEWLETTPLGKAEWMKMMAALLNKEEQAAEKFHQISEEYQRLKGMVGELSEKPLVINNLPYKGAWFVSGGESFTAQYLKDAGAGYPWFDNSSTGGLRKNFEVVYEAGLKADIWINPGAAESMEDILQKDSRFRDFKSYRTGQIFNNNRRMSPSGGNDFWESGVVHPDRVLADLIHIFHPEVLPDRELFYYQKLEKRE